MNIIPIETVREHHATILERVQALRRYAKAAEAELAEMQTAHDLCISREAVRDALGAEGVAA